MLLLSGEGFMLNLGCCLDEELYARYLDPSILNDWIVDSAPFRPLPIMVLSVSVLLCLLLVSPLYSPSQCETPNMYVYSEHVSL